VEQRPVPVLHVPLVQPVVVQPGTQAPPSQMVAGGEQLASVTQPEVPEQRPVLVSQVEPAPHEPEVQPATQRPA
jgi:hypothetical protein